MPASQPVCIISDRGIPERLDFREEPRHERAAISLDTAFEKVAIDLWQDWLFAWILVLVRALRAHCAPRQARKVSDFERPAANFIGPDDEQPIRGDTFEHARVVPGPIGKIAIQRVKTLLLEQALFRGVLKFFRMHPQLPHLFPERVDFVVKTKVVVQERVAPRIAIADREDKAGVGKLAEENVQDIAIQRGRIDFESQSTITLKQPLSKLRFVDDSVLPGEEFLHELFCFRFVLRADRFGKHPPDGMGAALTGANTVKSRPARAMSSEHSPFRREQQVRATVRDFGQGHWNLFSLKESFRPSHAPTVED